jgi:hypothetical protein
MEELVVSFGFGVALCYGVVFFAMILRAALISARSRSRSKIVDPARLLQTPPSFDDCDLVRAVRGYDTPELCRDDTKARHRGYERCSN